MIVNAVVLWDNRGLRLSKGELDKSYQGLKASFDELETSFDELNQTYWDKSYQDLLASFDELKASFDELKTSFDELNQTNWEMEIKYLDLEASFLGLFDDPFSPPVSKFQAILMALEHGGWNSSNLRGLVVTASLDYMRFWATKMGSGFEVLHEVKNPVSDYSPVVEGDITYRYVWYVIVAQAGPWRTIPPPGSYFVDAATGEIVPRGMF
jgi:hypothetical protein